MPDHPQVVRRELEARVEDNKRRYLDYRDWWQDEAFGRFFDLGVLSLLLGREEEGLLWFAWVASKGSIRYALLSKHPDVIAEARRKPQPHQPGELLRLLAGHEDEEARRMATELEDEVALAILDADADRLAKALNESLKRHKRRCGRNRSAFNSVHGFLYEHGAAYSVLAVDRGLPVRIAERYTRAQLQWLSISLEDDVLEAPPECIEVDLIPRIYREPGTLQLAPGKLA